VRAMRQPIVAGFRGISSYGGELARRLFSFVQGNHGEKCVVELCNTAISEGEDGVKAAYRLRA